MEEINGIHTCSLKKETAGNSLAVQWLGLEAVTAKGPGSVPSLGTKTPRTSRHGQKKRKTKKSKPSQSKLPLLDLPGPPGQLRPVPGHEHMTFQPGARRVDFCLNSEALPHSATDSTSAILLPLSWAQTLRDWQKGLSPALWNLSFPFPVYLLPR